MGGDPAQLVKELLWTQENVWVSRADVEKQCVDVHTCSSVDGDIGDRARWVFGSLIAV